MHVKWLIIVCLPVLLSTDSGLLLSPNLKKAYEHHYQGSLLYAEGQYRQANNQFQQAYKIIPTNFYFGLSYGLSLGKIGKTKPGLQTIRQANQHLSPFDPEYF